MSGSTETPTDAMQTTGPPLGRQGGARLRTLLAVAVTAIVVAVAAFVVGHPDGAGPGITLTGDTSGPPPTVGVIAPDFTATTVDGEAVSLGSLRGQPVWLTFGASWCADCRAEAPDLQATWETFRDRGLAVLGIFVGEGTEAVADYAGRAGLTFPLVADPDTRIASRYRTRAFPTHVFIDADGVVREIRLGGLEPAEMERLVTDLVQ